MSATEILRRELTEFIEAGGTYTAIGKIVGVSHASLVRFHKHGSTINLDLADRLLAFFKADLRMAEQPVNVATARKGRSLNGLPRAMFHTVDVQPWPPGLSPPPGSIGYVPVFADRRKAEDTGSDVASFLAPPAAGKRPASSQTPTSVNQPQLQVHPAGPRRLPA